jgi:streptogramin lyase
VLLLLISVSACGSGSGNSGSPLTSPPSTSVTAADPETGDPAWVTGRVTTGSQPCGILGAAGKIWVSDLGNDDLVSVDPRTMHVGPAVEVGAKPCGLAFGAGSIWVEDYGSAEVTRSVRRAVRCSTRTAWGCRRTT